MTKSNIPMAQFPNLVAMQRRNASDLGTTQFSEKACKKMVFLISETLKRRLQKYIEVNKLDFSLMVDESTTIVNTTALIIYIRVYIPSVGPQNFFWRMVELPSTTGEAIAEFVDSSLSVFDDEFVRKHFIAMAADGASAMTGKFQGAGSKLKEKYRNLIIIHCLAHRLELCVGDTINVCKDVCAFNKVTMNLYAIYSKSAKNLRELKGISQDLALQLQSIKRVFTVRWCFSSLKAVGSLLQNLPALRVHLRRKKANLTRTLKFCRQQTKRSQHLKKLLRRVNLVLSAIQSFTFLAQTAFLYDCLQPLAELSLYLQSTACNPLRINKKIEDCYHSISHLKYHSGKTMKELAVALKENGKFRGIPLHASTEALVDFKKLRCKFVEILLERFDERFSDSSKILHWSACLDKKNWPEDSKVLAQFGRNDVSFLSQKFGLNDFVAVRQYQKWKENTEPPVDSELMKLMNKIQILPYSSAACERGFSAMNLVWSDRRTQFQFETVEKILFLKCNGPDVQDFKEEDYIEEFIRHHRDALARNDMNLKRKNAKTDNASLEAKKARVIVFSATSNS